MSKTINVGHNEQKTVSEVNHEIFLAAQKILEEEQYLSHIGWSGVGKFIDWLEENYKIERKRVSDEA